MLLGYYFDNMLNNMWKGMYDDAWTNMHDDSYLDKLVPLSKLTPNITKTEIGYIIRLVVPGFEEKELEVRMNDGVLVLSGKHEKSEDKNYLARSFYKEYTLPSDVQLENISAEYKAGILLVTLPRKENTPVSSLKSIPIKCLP